MVDETAVAPAARGAKAGIRWSRSTSTRARAPRRYAYVGESPRASGVSVGVEIARLVGPARSSCSPRTGEELDGAASPGDPRRAGRRPQVPAATVVRLSGDAEQQQSAVEKAYARERESAGSSRSTAWGRSRAARRSRTSACVRRASRAAATTCSRTTSSSSPTARSTSSSTSSRTSRDSRRCCSSSSPGSRRASCSRGTRRRPCSSAGGRAACSSRRRAASRAARAGRRTRSAAPECADAGSSSRSGRSRRRPRPRPSSDWRCSRPLSATATTSASRRSASCSASSGVGAMLTLLPWGLAADRVGERVTGAVGLLGASAALAASAYAPDFTLLVVLLAVAGASGASINTATGRAVTSWFPREIRGFALGHPADLGSDRRLRGRARHPADRRPLGLRVLRCSCSPASRSSPPCSPRSGSWRGRCAADERDRPRRLRHPLRDRRIWRLSLGSCAADLHAGRDHRLRRHLPRVAARPERHRGRARARGDQRRRRGGPAAVGSAVRPPGREPRRV